MNIHPYLKGCSIDAAIKTNADNSCKNASFEFVWNRLIKRPDISKHQIVVGETGWPTTGPGIQKPVPTKDGNLLDAARYYDFLYTFLKDQKINGTKQSVPFFVFSAFDEPMNGIFGFSSNYWGVYNFDSAAKMGMVYPFQRNIEPKKKRGTNIKIILPLDSPYNNVSEPVLFKTKGNIYSNKLNPQKIDKQKVYSFINQYPYVMYSISQGPLGSEHLNVVTLILPNGGDNTHQAATCTNELLSGNGYGLPEDMTLKWKYPHSKEEFCQYINWADNGIWIN